MNKKVKSVALLAVLSLAATGCQKESFDTINNCQIQQFTNTYDVLFSINGVLFHRTIYGEQQWFEFIDWMLSLTEDGYKVMFRDNNTFNSTQSSKERVTYETNDKEDANKWCNKMHNDGYEVTMYFDERTGKYVCIAEK